MNPPTNPDHLRAGLTKNARYIFRLAPGHFAEDTLAARQRLIETATNPNCYLGKDKYGTDWYAQTLTSGEQIWVQVRNGEIRNAGINPIPRIWQPGIGLVGSP
jgi:hypothetical protein